MLELGPYGAGATEKRALPNTLRKLSSTLLYAHAFVTWRRRKAAQKF